MIASRPSRAGNAKSDSLPLDSGLRVRHWIEVSARRDGSFTVTIGRNQVSKTYKP